MVSILAAVITYWQTKLVRQTIESQTFTTLLERASEIDISAALDFIGTLRYTDYESFQNSVPQEKQAHIRAVVDFFNDLSHMIRGGYIDDFYPIRIYQPALFTCHKQLLPWWLEVYALDGIQHSTRISVGFANTAITWKAKCL